MGITGQVTQAGNTTVGWTLSGGDLTRRSLIVQWHEGGNSGFKLDNIVSRINPNRYEFRTTVIGPEPVAFRIIHWTVPV